MFNPNKAKQTLYWLILAIITVIVFFPVIAAAKEPINYDEEIFINYEKFHSKTISSKPSGVRFTNRNGSGQSGGGYSGRHYSKEEVKNLITAYAQEFKIGVETPLCIARLESGYNQFSKNKSSSDSGVFQYLNSTWKGTDEGRAGRSVFDAEANVKAAIKYMAIHKNIRPWVVAPKCPPLKFL